MPTWCACTSATATRKRLSSSRREDLDEIYAFIKKKNPAIRIMDYAAPEPKSSKKHKK